MLSTNTVICTISCVCPHDQFLIDIDSGLEFSAMICFVDEQTAAKHNKNHAKGYATGGY